jgi:hypothetical protein
MHSLYRACSAEFAAATAFLLLTICNYHGCVAGPESSRAGILELPHSTCTACCITHSRCLVRDMHKTYLAALFALLLHWHSGLTLQLQHRSKAKTVMSDMSRANI